MNENNFLNSEMRGWLQMLTNVEEHLTLGEIEIELKFLMKLQQELERKFNVKIDIKLIKAIDVKMLKEYETGKVENIQDYIKELQKAVDALDQYRFIIPSEPFTRLNDVEKGKPIYFMPPIEITYSAYKDIAKRINRPVIGINWTKDMNKIERFKEYKFYILDLMKKLEPKGQLDVVGYHDGKEAAAKLGLKGFVRKAVIIDIMNDNRVEKENGTDQFLTEMVFGFLSYKFPSTFQNKVTRAISKEPDVDSKVNRIVSELKGIAGKGMVATDLAEIIKLLIQRSKYNYKYRNKKKSRIPNSLINKFNEQMFKLQTRQLFAEYTDFDNENDENEGTPTMTTTSDKNKTNEIYSMEFFDCEHSVTSELIANKIVKSFN